MKCEESYLVLIIAVKTEKAFYILAPNRQAMGDMLKLMPRNYLVSSVTMVPTCGNYDEFMAHLRVENKPPGMYFGIIN